MFAFNGDDMSTILHIIYLSASSGAHHGKSAQHITRPPHSVSLAGTINTTSTAPSEISNASTSEFHHESRHDPLTSRLKKLENDLVDITQGFSRDSDVTKHISILFKNLQYEANMLQSVCKDILLAPGANTSFSADRLNANVDRMTNLAAKLKSEIPRPGNVRVQSAADLVNHLLTFPASLESHVRKALEDFENNYKRLDQRSQKCLFCFSVFPENSFLSKTRLMYWWIGEGLIDPQVDGDKISELVANNILKQFLEFQFIEPITENGKLVWLRMHPVIRYAVAYLAERANFFDFDLEWNPTADFQLCQRACLVKAAHGSSQKQLIEVAHLHPEKLKTVLNVNEDNVDISGKWFQKLTNLNVLCLDRLHTYSDYIYNVKGIKSLKSLKDMMQLKYLGLRGVHTLPEDIEKLENLRVLTLNDWNGLNKLPMSMTLRRLTHLEFELNMLVRKPLPKVITELTELQVLKGFYIIRYPEEEEEYFATLDDLVGLRKLRKLSIVVWAAQYFPLPQDMDALNHINSLRRLTIWWPSLEASSQLAPWDEVPRIEMIPTLPLGLQKLDLWNFPMSKAPFWLMPGSLENLEKLYIRKGKLHDLGENDKWKVKILRLIDLPEFYMDWRRVWAKFPDLIYLETNECPKLTSFPCDTHGVWLNKRNLTEKKLEELGFSWSFLATYDPNE